MIKNIIIGLFTICYFIGCSTKDKCLDLVLYRQAFDQLKISSNRSREAISFQFDYIPSEFTLNSVKRFKIFSEQEFARLNEELKEEKYAICDTVKNVTNKMMSMRQSNDEKYYIQLRYSKPLYLSETKACIFLIQMSKNKNYSGGRAIGEEILFIFNKEDDTWKFKEKKALGMF